MPEVLRLTGRVSDLADGLTVRRILPSAAGAHVVELRGIGSAAHCRGGQALGGWRFCAHPG